MNKQILTTILGIFLMIGLVSASSSDIRIEIDKEWNVDFFAGETIVNEFKVCNEYNEDKEIDLSYEISGMTYNDEGITFEFSNDNFELREDKCKDINFIITSQPNYKPDSFMISIYADEDIDDDDDDDDDEDSSWIYGTCDWNCKSWSDCSDGTQTRKCSRTTLYCSNNQDKPDEEQSCEEVIVLEVETDDDDDDDEETSPNVTVEDGENTDDKTPPSQKSRWVLGILIFIIALIVVIYLIFKISGNKNASEEVDEDDEPKDDEPKDDEPKDDEDDGDYGEDYEPIEGLDMPFAEPPNNPNNPKELNLPTSTTKRIARR